MNRIMSLEPDLLEKCVMSNLPMVGEATEFSRQVKVTCLMQMFYWVDVNFENIVEEVFLFNAHILSYQL